MEGNLDVRSVAISPDSRVLAFASTDDRSIWLWSIGFSKPFLFSTLPTKSTCVVFAPDGLALAAACGNDGVQLWQAPTDREVYQYYDRNAQMLPKDADRQLDFVLACWSRFVHHDPAEREDARQALLKGRDKLRQLQAEGRLKPEQERWINEFAKALAGR
jgi:hypothetical protein